MYEAKTFPVLMFQLLAVCMNGSAFVTWFTQLGLPGTLLASEVGRGSFPNCSISLDSDIARMIKLCGHIQCSRNTHLLGELGHVPAMKIYFEIIHSEIVS